MPASNIAMWSGPRNLSTAMMYAFGARSDCAVWDEPFYAAYLRLTGLDHPMREAIIAAGEPDPARVASRCAAPADRPLFYQKHMTHHMVPGVPRDWFGSVAHVFLIRHPARVLASYDRKRERATLDDIGFRQQAEIFDAVRAQGLPVTVIDSAEIRAAPEPMLRRLCAALAIPYDPAMTRWPAGGHKDDGVWAAHWYDAVHRSTGFAGAEGPLPVLDGALAGVCAEALPYYEKMRAEALRP
ncbi:HAD family hydrolase [Ponticoccus sp. (in: a-proteobacteria)]|uniref:sulfotransferase-like domain-containing protein n=1 Tax=Ponticoccus sp. (in: a-proteobacteria) TaxID=1925025 RepID=UPI003AB44AB9